MRRLAELVDGFETPYGLELLATVHFAAGFDPATTDRTVLMDRVRTWSGRKVRLFTPAHIRLADDRLSGAALLPSLAST